MAYSEEQLQKISELEASSDGTPIDVGDYTNGEPVDGLTWNTRLSIIEALFTRLYSRLKERYLKPSTGIPESDLSNGVQVKLGKAVTAYQKPAEGIPATDLTTGAQGNLTAASTAYQKPSDGIPASDLAAAVQTSLSKADTALQSVVTSWKAPVANEAALPVVGNSDGDVRLTLDESKLYRWTADPGEWSLAAGGSSAELKVDKFVATADQTDFTLSWAPAGASTLLVFANGTLVDSLSYSLLNSTLTFASGIPLNTKIWVIGGNIAGEASEATVTGAMSHFSLMGTSDGSTTDYALPTNGAEEIVLLGYGQLAVRGEDYDVVDTAGSKYIRFKAGKIPASGVKIHGSASIELLPGTDANTLQNHPASDFALATAVKKAELFSIGSLAAMVDLDADFSVCPSGFTLTKVVVACPTTPASGTVTVDLLKVDAAGGSAVTLYTSKDKPTITCNGGYAWAVYSGAALPDVTTIPDGCMLIARVVSAPAGAADLKVEVY